jgi:hypothetical protein
VPDEQLISKVVLVLAISGAAKCRGLPRPLRPRTSRPGVWRKVSEPGGSRLHAAAG